MFRTFIELQKYFTAEDRRQWVVLLLISLAAGLSQSLTLAVFNEAVAAYGEGKPNLYYLPMVVALLAVAVAAGLFGALHGHKVSTRMAVRLRNRLLDQLGEANLRVVERIGSSELHNHLMSTIGNLAGSYGALLGFATSLVMLICNFIYIGYLSMWGLAAAILITIVGLMVHFRQERLIIERKWLLDQLSRKADARHREVLDGYKELRLLKARWLDYRRRIDKVNDELYVQGLQVTRVSTTGSLATSLFQFLLILLVVFALPLFVRLDAVVLMQLMTAILVTLGPLSGVVRVIPAFSRAHIALTNLKMLQKEIDATREPVNVPEGRTLGEFRSIELAGIEFAFESDFSSEAFRLGPIDLTILRGEVILIVGGNGSGKTVLLRVLTALYYPTAGRILYNDAEVTPVDRQAYREQFSTVFSDFYLFQELIGGKRVDAAALQGWLERMDLADKTHFDGAAFSSVALSAGQRKRLAFTLAVLEDHPICVLDEFGAEQDPEHRRRFYRELIPELRSRGKTVIVVTHDDAYFDAGDRVVKMDFGRIVSETRPVAERDTAREPTEILKA